MEDTLKILESVDSFYAQSFGQLITIAGLLLAFAGFLMPVLITFLQQRFFKLENGKIKFDIEKELTLKHEKRVEEIEQEFDKREVKYEAMISDLEKRMEKETLAAIAGILHVQGNVNINSQQYSMATYSFLRASINNLISDKEMLLRITLDQLFLICFPNIYLQDFESNEDLKKEYSELLRLLEEANINGRYGNEIKKLKFMYSNANKRDNRQPQPPRQQYPQQPLRVN